MVGGEDVELSRHAKHFTPSTPRHKPNGITVQIVGAAASSSRHEVCYKKTRVV